jgi:hypothetical protein
VASAEASSPRAACEAAHGATGAPAPSCKHAINTKGTGASGRAAGQTPPTTCEHAISTKGTGVAGRVQSSTASAEPQKGHAAAGLDHPCMAITEQGVPAKKDHKK